MKDDILFLVWVAGLSGFVSLCLYGISRIKRKTIHERGHLAFSLLPWIYLFGTYAVAFYIRIGFGSWPRPYIDNPDLPLIDVLVYCLLLSFLLSPFGAFLWLGWLILRLRMKMARYWIASLALFLSGIVMMILAQYIDPWDFWDWAWD